MNTHVLRTLALVAGLLALTAAAVSRAAETPLFAQVSAAQVGAVDAAPSPATSVAPLVQPRGSAGEVSGDGHRAVRGDGKPEDRPGRRAGQAREIARDPAYTVSGEALDASLTCSDLTDQIGSDREPVLLVHGTFTWGEEQFGWSWLPMLDDREYDWCIVTYPDRGFGDMQISAEYVAHAVQTMHEQTGRPVDMAGHSQGGLMPRWALKYWPSVNAAVDDFVMLASPNHGTTVAGGGDSQMSMPASFWQMRHGSEFVTALNADDESPGDVSYTSLYTVTDELVQPSTGPDATALLAPAPNVTNLSLQEACPGRLVDHLTIGTTDRASMELTLAAFAQAGPLDPDALDLPALCRAAPQEAGSLYAGLDDAESATGLPVGTAATAASGTLPEPFQRFDSLGPSLDLFRQDLQRGAPDWHMTDREPALRDYASGDAAG